MQHSLSCRHVTCMQRLQVLWARVGCMPGAGRTAAPFRQACCRPLCAALPRPAGPPDDMQVQECTDDLRCPVQADELQCRLQWTHLLHVDGTGALWPPLQHLCLDLHQVCPYDINEMVLHLPRHLTRSSCTSQTQPSPRGRWTETSRMSSARWEISLRMWRIPALADFLMCAASAAALEGCLLPCVCLPGWAHRMKVCMQIWASQDFSKLYTE